MVYPHCVLIRVFGQVAVVLDDESKIALPDRPATVLALLASRFAQLVTDDELIDAIWPTSPPRSAKTALQGYVGVVRDALEPGRSLSDAGRHVLRERTGYRLVVNDDELDLAEFRRLASQARPWPESVLGRLIEVSASEPFREFPEAQWAHEVRATVAETRVESLIERFELDLEVGDGASILADLRAAHAEFPFDERIAQLVMLALYRNGRQHETLELYSALRTRLRDELGLSPNPQVEALRLDVLDHAPGLLLPVQVGTGSATLVGPTPPSGLLGRAADTVSIADALLADRTVTVVGPGGVGKSSILRAVVDELQDKFVRHVSIDIATVPTSEIADAIAQELGIEMSLLSSLSAVVSDVIGAAPTLIVVDTCEVAAEALRPVLAELFDAPGVHVLLASRTPVGHRGERQYRLDPLTIDDSVSLLRRASIRDDHTDIDGLVELAQRLDGLPLALDMVAPKLAAIGPRAILDGIDAWFIEPQQEGGAPSPGPSRHQSVQALVEWSLDLIGPEQVAVLARIAAMTGDVVLDALTDLPPLDNLPADNVLDVVGSLVDASLIRRLDDAPTFRLFDTVAAVVELKHGAEVQSQRDVLAQHVTLAAWGDYAGTGASTVGSWVPQQFSGCLEHLAVQPDARGVMLATAAARNWLDCGVIQHGRRALERALAGTADLPKPLASIGWTVLGFNQSYQGDFAGAIRSYRTAAETADTVPFPGVVELVGSTLAWLECDFGRSWQIASSVVEDMTVPTRRAPANLLAFAKFAVFAEDLVGAADCYERARGLAADLDDPIAGANALRLAAVVRSLEGDHDLAWRWAHQSLVVHDPVRSPLGAAQAASSMALIAMLSGDDTSAENWSRIALERLRRQFDIQTVSVTVPVIAALSVRTGRVEHAARLIGWLDSFIDGLQHVHHPTARAVDSEVREVLDNEDRRTVRAWAAAGAALTLTEMLQLATS